MAATANIRQAIAIRFHGGKNKTGGDSCMPTPVGEKYSPLRNPHSAKGEGKARSFAVT
jgi:hypothetical protein